MADYYVDFATGNDTTGDGSSGTPWKTVKKATDTVTAGNHRILFSDTAADNSIGAGTTTYTVAAGVRIIGTAGISTTYSSRTATVLTTATNAQITINGGQWNGIVFQHVASSGVGLTIASVASYTEMRDCKFTWPTTPTASSGMAFGGSGAGYLSVARLIDCDYTCANTGGDMIIYSCFVTWIGGTFPTLTALCQTIGSRGVTHAHFEGCDLSGVTTLLNATPATSTRFEFVNCKLNASVVPLGSSPGDGVDCYLYDCANGDTHYNFAHYDKYGSTVATTAAAASGGALWDGTTGISWSVSSTASASQARPYYTPWIDVVNSATAAVTPYLETMRTAASGAGTAYTDAEVWAEWLVKTGGADPRTVFSADRAGYTDATGTAQTASSLGTGDWTGEGATYTFVKLGGSFTPADKGYIRARVAIGKASVTDLFVDPFVRGL